MIRPLDQRDPILGFIPAKLSQLVWRLDAVKVKMEDLKAGRVIGLKEGVGRARNVHFWSAQRSHKTSGEGGFTRAETTS